MMMRFFVLLVQLGVLVTVALWLADNPGSAHIVWHDTVIETSAAFLALASLGVGFVFYLIFRLWHFFRHGPAHWRLRRRLERMRKSQHQLARGLIAIASGNAAEAGRLAVAARKEPGNEVAAQWLQAQAAHLAGDKGAAREIFRALSIDPDAAILGYRGLISEARRMGDWAEMDRLLLDLRRIKPSSPWLSLMRMESASRRRNWLEAENALAHAAAANILNTATARQHRAALRIAQTRAATLSGNKDEALRHAEEAARQAPDWLPATLNLADRLAASGHRRTVLRLIERVWKQTPHPQLLIILRQLFVDPLEAFKQVEKIARGDTRVESRLAFADAALSAHIWGEARRHLTLCTQDGTATQGVYKMLSWLETRERNDERAATAWLAQLSDAPADPAWLCEACGGSHTDWHPICAHCHAFDKIEWRQSGKGLTLTQPHEAIG